MDPETAMLASVIAVVAAFCDWRTGRIPNGLNAAAVAVALLVATSGMGIATATGGLAVGAIVGAALFFAGSLGGGDAKLMAALGAACGPVAFLEIAVWSFAIAAAWAFVRAWREGVISATIRELRLLGLTLMTPGVRPAFRPPDLSIRFAPSIAIGVILVAWWPASRFLDL